MHPLGCLAKLLRWFPPGGPPLPPFLGAVLPCLHSSLHAAGVHHTSSELLLLCWALLFQPRMPPPTHLPIHPPMLHSAEAGAPWHDQDGEGFTAGEYASGSRHTHIVELLMDWAVRSELILGELWV